MHVITFILAQRSVVRIEMCHVQIPDSHSFTLSVWGFTGLSGYLALATHCEFAYVWCSA